jgi:hypothetical protein
MWQWDGISVQHWNPAAICYHTDEDGIGHGNAAVCVSPRLPQLAGQQQQTNIVYMPRCNLYTPTATCLFALVNGNSQRFNS